MTLIKQTLRILNKEFIQERNSKFFINSVFMFSFLLIMILIFPFANIDVDLETKNIIFWVILYFSTLSGFQNIFLKEVDRHTIIHLKSHFSDQPIFWGKALFNMVSMYVVISLILIIYSILFNFEEILEPIIFLFLFLIVISLAINGTLMSSLISFSKNSSTIYAIIGFPILFPIFLIGINGTSEFILNGNMDTMIWVSVLSYDIITFLLSYLLFEYIWEQL